MAHSFSYVPFSHWAKMLPTMVVYIVWVTCLPFFVCCSGIDINFISFWIQCYLLPHRPITFYKWQVIAPILKQLWRWNNKFCLHFYLDRIFVVGFLFISANRMWLSFEVDKWLLYPTFIFRNSFLPVCIHLCVFPTCWAVNRKIIVRQM